MADDPPTEPPTEPPAEPPPKPPRNVTNIADRRMRARAILAPMTRPERLRLAMEILPEDCPFRPVGYDGPLYYLIDARDQLVAVAGDKLKTEVCQDLCMPNVAWLTQHFPRMRDGKKVSGFSAGTAAVKIKQACTAMGRWSPAGGVRGRGAWRGEDGDLVLHRGDHVMIRGARLRPGLHGEFLYPARAALPGVAEEWQMAEVIGGPGRALLDRLAGFAWNRGALDAEMVLGWIVAAMLGGALDFRPHVFITGEFAAGKSTLQALLRRVFGEGGIVSVSDTSAAGLWQAFGADSLPAGVDELEAEADGRKQAELIKLIRQATSGGLVLRGGSDHSGVSFSVVSAFLASAIIVPPMASQDASRFHVLHLLTLPPGTIMPPLELDGCELIGRALLRRMAVHFGRARDEVLPAFTRRLLEAGYPRRAADLYGILLGMADVALHDVLDLARLDRWIAHRWMVEIRESTLRDQTPEWMRCWDFLASSRVDPRTPASEAIGELMSKVAAGLRRSPEAQGQRIMAGMDAGDGLDDESEAARAHVKLQSLGLRLTWGAGGELPPGLTLYIANQHRALAAIFDETPWRTIANAAGGGGWAHVLRRMPGAASSGNAVRFRSGVRSRAVALPVAELLPADDRAGFNAAGGGGAAEQPSRLN